MQPKRFGLFLVGVLISGAGFYLALRHVPVNSLLVYVRRVEYGWIVATLVMLACAYGLRAWRWQFLLRPIGRISLVMAYHSIVVSLMINCVLPGRLGEMARPLVLKRREGLAFSASLATLAVERLLDTATLLFLLIVGLAQISTASARPVVFGAHTLSADLLMHLARTSAVVLVLLVAGLLMIAHNGMRIWLAGIITGLINIVGRRFPLTRHRIPTFSRHVEKLLDRFAEGLQCLKNPVNLLKAALLSLFTWLLNALSFYGIVCGSPGIDIGFFDALVMMVIICFFIALPSVPGYWGLWEAAGVFALTFFGIDKEPAAGFTLLNHAVQILPLIFAGWVSCLLLGLRWSDMTENKTVGSRPEKTGL